VTEPTVAPTSRWRKTILQATHACVLPDPKTYEGMPLGEYFMECKECEELWCLQRKLFSRRLVWSTIRGGGLGYWHSFGGPAKLWGRRK
jgi:hypothetical protein